MIDSHLKYERDAIAGPGHKPTKPQPIPKMIAPKIRETPSLFVFGVSNCPDNSGFSLFKMYLKEISVVVVAEANTKSKLGSQFPKISRKLMIFCGLIISDMARPKPNKKPKNMEIRFFNITYKPIQFLRVNTVRIATPRNTGTAMNDLRDSLPMPLTPCPLVQPLAILVPNPVKTPPAIIRVKEPVISISCRPAPEYLNTQQPRTRPTRNSILHKFSGL